MWKEMTTNRPTDKNTSWKAKNKNCRPRIHIHNLKWTIFFSPIICHHRRRFIFLEINR